MDDTAQRLAGVLHLSQSADEIPEIQVVSRRRRPLIAAGKESGGMRGDGITLDGQPGSQQPYPFIGQLRTQMGVDLAPQFRTQPELICGLAHFTTHPALPGAAIQRRPLRTDRVGAHSGFLLQFIQTDARTNVTSHEA